ncbi:MAG: 16S rRNA (adenine(1518)-N(6)/adenine(1519)-N(6))-dimethyltransferase RsmA [Syntrophotaleaceae bacterium]
MQHQFKKRFGQNFLRDAQVIERILQAAELDRGDRVLEIGPGLGALTDHLLPRADVLHVMEIDRDLIDALLARGAANLIIHAGDALRLEWDKLLTEPPYKLVANLPYNISSQVLFKILDHSALFSRLVLMFQQEVGERICAAPGGRDYGILSVLCQVRFDIRRVVKVAPGAFYPPPKVNSVVLRFDPLPQPRVQIGDEAFFRRVVKSAFSQRRKTLANSLKGGGFGDMAHILHDSLEGIGIDPGRRAETLSLEEFAALARLLQNH